MDKVELDFPEEEIIIDDFYRDIKKAAISAGFKPSEDDDGIEE